MYDKVKDGLKSLSAKNTHHYFTGKYPTSVLHDNNQIKQLVCEKIDQDQATYRIELSEPMTFYKAFKTKRPDPKSHNQTKVVKELFQVFGADGELEWLGSSGNPFNEDPSVSKFEIIPTEDKCSNFNIEEINPEVENLTLVDHETIPEIGLDMPPPDSYVISKQSTFLTNVRTPKTEHQKRRIENSDQLLADHDKFFKNFVSTYSKMVSKDEVRAIMLSKLKACDLSKDEISAQTEALINFIYRHFHYLSNLKEIKKMIVSSLSTTVSCETFFDLKFEEKLKNFMSRLRNRHLDIQKELFELHVPNIRLLPKKFDVNSLKRVFIMNGHLEPYFKRAEVNDAQNFALFFYSQQTIDAVRSESYDHVFIDGTKSCLPYDQRFQLLMINFYLNKGISTTGIYVLMRGSNEKLYDTVFSCVNNIIPIRDKEIHVDFERAMMNALIKLTPNLKMCHFHYARNLQDRVRDLQRVYKKKISKRLYEYGKILMYVPPKYVEYHRNYMDHMAGRSKNNKRFLEYLDKNYIDKKYRAFLFQGHSKFLTNNLSEAVNSQFSKFFNMRPKKNQWLDFLQYNEKRVIHRRVSRSLVVDENDFDSFDLFVRELQSKSFPSYKSYKRFLYQNQRAKGLKKNQRPDCRFFRRT